MPTTTETVEYHAPPPWFADISPAARRGWHDRIVPALLKARDARRKRDRARALLDAGEVVAEVVDALGGLDDWHAELLLYTCSDIAGVGLPITAADLPHWDVGLDFDDVAFPDAS